MLNTLFPAFNSFQVWLASILPYAGSITIWGAIAGVSAMGIYSIMSNQAVISKLKIETRGLRRQMMDPSIKEHSEFNALAMKNLKLSLALLGKVIAPAMFSAIPVLLIAVWLDIYQGYVLPEEQQAIDMTVYPVDATIKIFPPGVVQKSANGIAISPIHKGNISMYSEGHLVYSGNPFVLPVPVIAKKQWWNKLLASEAGYLTNDAPIQKIWMGFPKKKVLEGMPAWAEGWEIPFFLSVMLAALVVKFIFRIH